MLPHLHQRPNYLQRHRERPMVGHLVVASVFWLDSY